MQKTILIIFLFFAFSSCYKGHLYVQQEWVDNSSLASTIIDTPNKNLSLNGQRLLISWDFPISIFQKNLSIMLTIRFRNNTQNTISFHLDYKRGSRSFYFPKEESDNILTYKVDVIAEKKDEAPNKEVEVIETWKHQFWVELIDVDKE